MGSSSARIVIVARIVKRVPMVMMAAMTAAAKTTGRDPPPIPKEKTMIGGEYMLNLLNNLDKQVTPSKPSGKSGKKLESKGEGGNILLNNVASKAVIHLPESDSRGFVCHVKS